MINPKYLALASHYLEKMQEEYGNHGCNDLEEVVEREFDSWPQELQDEFLKLADKWNGGGDMKEDYEKPANLADFVVIGTLSYILAKASIERWNPESERGILEHMRTLEEIKSDIDDETEDYA